MVNYKLHLILLILNTGMHINVTGMDQAKTCIPYDSVEFMSDADVASMRIPEIVYGRYHSHSRKDVNVMDGLLMDMKGSVFDIK